MATDTIEPSMLEKAAGLDVLDASGKSTSFGSLFNDQKTIIVFIRHFHCGRCQDYSTQLAEVRDEALQNAQTRILLIGCGQPSLIEKYKVTTGFPGDIYADPYLHLFKALGLGSRLSATPAGEEKRSYIKGGPLASAAKSIWNGPIQNPLEIGKQGPYAQLGGEFVLGPGQQCIFAHRMQHSEDHVNVDALLQEAGVAYP